MMLAWLLLGLAILFAFLTMMISPLFLVLVIVVGTLAALASHGN